MGFITVDFSDPNEKFLFGNLDQFEIFGYDGSIYIKLSGSLQVKFDGPNCVDLIKRKYHTLFTNILVKRLKGTLTNLEVESS
jgi:hypothetical protein